MNSTDLLNVQLLTTTAITYIPKLIAAVLIFIAFVLLYRITRTPLERLLRRAEIEAPVINLVIYSVLKWVIIIFGALMAVKQLGVDVGAALAGLGVAGIAIGFAAQDSLSNIIAGFIIFIDKPFRVGDWVEVDGHYGKIWEITMRSTRIQTLNHTYIVIPNKTIINEVLNNHSKYGQTRIEIAIGIAYKESIDHARKVLLQSVVDLPHIADDPKPSVVVQNLGDSSVHLILRIWIQNAEKEKEVYFAAIEAGKKALDTAGIEIPFPHLQLFMDDVTDRAKRQLQQVLTQKL